ncbi:hypothetical protein LINGRAHAP2_LOCUS410 [Linum grandiflorum]
MPKALHHVLQAMARQWRISPSDLQIFDVGHGLLQFVFSTMEIKLRVYQSQPWAFKSAIMHLVPWEEPSQDLYDRLRFMPLVIQLMDLPRQCNSVKFAIKLVRPLGYKVKAVDYSEASTSKQKPKHLKPIPYVFHTMVTADGTPISDVGQSSGASSMVCDDTPPISGNLDRSKVVSIGMGFRCSVSNNLRTFEFKTGFINCCVSQSSTSPDVVIPLPSSRTTSLRLYRHSSMNLFYCKGPAFMDYMDDSVTNLALHSGSVPLSDMHVLNLSDKKRPRMEDDEASSLHYTKKLKAVPELTLDDFPEHVLNLELLPEDIMEGAEVSDALINSAAGPTSLGSEVRLQGPPAPG